MADPRRVVMFVVPNGELKAVAYWGGAVQIVDAGGVVRAAYALPQDVTAVAWASPQLVVGDADGRVVALNVKRLGAGRQAAAPREKPGRRGA
jgi:hypothetical protein